jgi:formylglycine-generating enzyme required for sulfatase activity/serine/threonine protein phosphatase PrpC
MALQFEIAGAQIDGARDYQEDAFLVSRLTDAGGNPAALVIVADGMGGHAAGNVASNMAVQAFNKYISSNYPADYPPDILHTAVLRANSSIADTIRETPALEGMGCTMVAALVEDSKLWWASVGDSHLYLLRDKKITKQNADHSYGGFLDRMAASGNPIEPEAGLSRNMLMSAITGEDITEIDCPEQPLELRHGDRIILCSDGLDTLSTGKIIQYCEWSEKARECSETLLNAVEEAAIPRQDNATVIVLDVVDPAILAAQTEEPVPVLEAAEADDEEDQTAPQQSVPRSVAAVESRQSDRRGKAGILAVAAAVLVLAAVGLGYLFWQQSTPPAEVEPIVEAPPPAPAEPVVEPLPEPVDVQPVEPEPVETEPVPEPPVITIEAFRDNLRSGGVGPEMVWIPSGTFTMGSGRFPEERPQREVSVERFAISRHEITFAEYERFARATGRRIPDNMGMNKNTHPVIMVTWEDASQYAAWLSRETGKSYRLPSEAEWEYAAGAGRDTTYWWGFDIKPGLAHCFGCESGLDSRRPTAVGSFEANPFGLYDMYGNVAEWVQDCWNNSYAGAPSDGQAWTDGDCSYRVVRGGSYLSPPPSIRTARRDRFRAASTYDTIGIRVVREE